ncbi:UNKNOWN [Stylonychia lemnae]|uniref:Uncharacterized protein n=1 Tax=Stylonychia lemnae TaxID=5949 RepID=A0A078B2M5_STYLE|nr:UNKNOWN [Stylonychia lemnae]|eukprot:CDW87738.1 UNKNOWN [Stylonychia lemnae]
MEKKSINSYSTIDSYAVNLQIKIRSSVCKKQNHSPRLNNANINLIKHDPENGNNYNFLREKLKIKEFKRNTALTLSKFHQSQPNLFSNHYEGEIDDDNFFYGGMGSNPKQEEQKYQFDDEGNLMLIRKPKKKEIQKKVFDLSTKESANETFKSQTQPFLLRRKLRNNKAGNATPSTNTQSANGGNQYLSETDISKKAQECTKILETDDVHERKRIEKEIWNETRRLQSQLQEIKDKRRTLLFSNNEIYIKMAKNKEEMKKEERNFQRRIKESKGILEKKLQSKNKLSLGDFMKMNMEKDRVNQMRVDKLNLDKRLNELKEINCEKIYYIEEEMSIVKTELAFIRNIQIEYYSKLLKQGNDIRGKGLIWIIETLWDLEYKIDKLQLPEILDERSKDFILEIATKDYEMAQIKTEYQKYKLQLKMILENESKQGSAENRKTQSKFQEIIRQKNQILNNLWCGGKVENRKIDLERIISPKSPQHNISQSYESDGIFWGNRHEKNESLEEKQSAFDQKLFLKLQNVVTNSSPGDRQLSESDMYELQNANVKVKEFEDKLGKLNEEIKEMKQREIGRIVKDCINENSYISKSQVNIKNLIYMLFGETTYEIEFFRQLRHTQANRESVQKREQRQQKIRILSR